MAYLNICALLETISKAYPNPDDAYPTSRDGMNVRETPVSIGRND